MENKTDAQLHAAAGSFALPGAIAGGTKRSYGKSMPALDRRNWT